MQTETAESLRAKADACRRSAEESFERCDTDGFLSQWADGMMGRVYDQEAEIAAAGGLAEFRELFDLEGNWVPAKRIATRYGQRWMLLDRNGHSLGIFLPVSPVRRSTLAKHGYVEGLVRRPAKARLESNGHGLSGNCWVATVPLSLPWEPPAAIVVTDVYSLDAGPANS